MLRLFTFRPDVAGDSADARIRQHVLPGLKSIPGLRYVYAARASAAEGDQRVVASVWDESAAGPNLDRLFDFEADDHAVDARVELHQIDIDLDFADAGTPQILRIFRGRTVAGQLDRYVEYARHGTMADALANHGPEALFLARIPPDQFVTVSAWSAWERIAASTGGNLRQPIATRHSELLEGGTAAFYEIVPNTPHGRADGAANGDATPAAGEQSPPPAGTSDVFLARPELPAIAPGT